VDEVPKGGGLGDALTEYADLVADAGGAQLADAQPRLENIRKG
jgi:hypothetical protein